MKVEDTSGEDWAAESDRAIDEHDPSREPYASMTRDEVFALMQDKSLTAYQYESLNQHFLDKCSTAELERINFSTSLSLYLIEAKGAHGNAQCTFINRLAGKMTKELFDDMPPPGPLHEIN